MIDANASMADGKNSYRVGRNVAKEVLAGMKLKPKLAILAVDALSRTSYDNKEVLRGVREELGPAVTLIGSTVNGLLVNNRYALKSVGLMLLGGDFKIDSSFSYPKSKIEYEDIANDLYNRTEGLPPNHNHIMLMFQDGYKFPPEVFKKQEMLNMRIVSLMSGLVTRFFKKQLDDFKEQGQGMTTVQELLEILYKSPVI